MQNSRMQQLWQHHPTLQPTQQPMATDETMAQAEQRNGEGDSREGFEGGVYQ